MAFCGARSALAETPLIFPVKVRLMTHRSETSLPLRGVRADFAGLVRRRGGNSEMLALAASLCHDFLKSS